MTTLLELKEKMKTAYGSYSAYVDIVLKFLLSCVCFFWIRMAMGYSSIFSNIFILLILALLCSVLPLKVIPICSGILITGQAFGLGIDAGIIMLVIYLVLIIMFIRFIPDDSLALIFTPMTMSFGFFPLVPICFGLRRKPVSILSVISGCIVYYQISMLASNADQLKKLELSEYATRLQLILGGFAANKEMIVNILAFSAVLIIVYAVRRMSFDHSFNVAIIIGGVVYIAFAVLGNVVVGTTMNLLVAAAGSAAACIIAAILQFFLLSVDYTGSEKMEFEDDDYYYYVKAIPKASAFRMKQRQSSKTDSEPEDGEHGYLPLVEKPDVESVDFEKKLEDSLKNL